MKFIQKLCFSGEAKEAIELYKRAFGCTVRSLLYYSDAVKNGWEQPNAEKEPLIYHSEIMFGEQEVRINDLSDQEEVILTKKVFYAVGFDTAEEVEKAFSVLSEGGEVIKPLERPPYMVIIGTVKDRFGVHWELMCDF
ncbi:VOC family protein [Ruminiclostridium herbifermentans]|uniref:VOC family protein n=1 Tax=Ruminiclostridium herbifermentans TaxID=2488810 RepID=A0A4V6EQC2_9FIRM|nr:VOC family protein [Ruminiclostridium herbifermentans]QNU67901.1 VOC family protein [Ruminiclostridium herbifermentans]